MNILQLYHFDSSTGSLTLIPTPTISFEPNSIDWCGDCCNYLAVGGQTLGVTPATSGLIQLFRGNTICLTPPTNLTAQKICHRFPTQVDIINQLCWSPVANAVAYNVYVRRRTINSFGDNTGPCGMLFTTSDCSRQNSDLLCNGG